jgi:hypothetical protein
MGGASKINSCCSEPSARRVLSASSGRSVSIFIPEKGIVVVQILMMKDSVPKWGNFSTQGALLGRKKRCKASVCLGF